MTAASAEALGVELRAAGISDVTVDDADRAAYSSDASLFRLVPQAVVLPRGEEDVARTLSVARRLGVPVVSRGAGTSIAGNAIGTGILLSAGEDDGLRDESEQRGSEEYAARSASSTVHR
ncbi:glycolate oxidase subunit GlcD [Brevibacterium casei]|uniref:Glycolate oxidase subunit GlcD n=1 Tax=Brevibacterium casei TaxID=33889 RepID=A0A449DBH8_9MICO|nr:FAD-binding protein [Brevibacterium casei]VEW14855.1 glycolate oxidase subunit GlcD [Brevibacterium casei]